MMQEFDEFIAIVRRLRKECPWDRVQTHESLRPSFLEEVYEAVEAIDHQAWQDLRNELGDILLHIGLQAAIAEEQSEFTFRDVVLTINEKLIRRHPHVFGEAAAPDLHAQKQNWEKIKMAEGRLSVLDGVPRELPALLRSARLQEKASKVGFDWTNVEDVWKKVEEELHELHNAKQNQTSENIEKEFGDVLFSLVNFARFLRVNPEDALRSAAEKFDRRFRYLESELRRQEKNIYHTTPEEMDALWNKSKQGEL